MLNINQNFDLKAPVFNFDRDYFNSVEELKAYDTSNVPDHFVTNVGGMLYQFTDGKWWPMVATQAVDHSKYNVIFGSDHACLEIEKGTDNEFYPNGFAVWSEDKKHATLYPGSFWLGGKDYTNYFIIDATEMSAELADGNGKAISASITDKGPQVSLTSGDFSSKLSARNGLTVTTDDPFMTNVNGETIDIIHPDGMYTSCGYFGMILSNQDNSERLRIGDIDVQDDNAIGLQLGKDYKSYIYRPLDESKGATITGVESIAAFTNPSATKVWATDGSTINMPTKFSDLKNDSVYITGNKGETDAKFKIDCKDGDVLRSELKYQSRANTGIPEMDFKSYDTSGNYLSQIRIRPEDNKDDGQYIIQVQDVKGDKINHVSTLHTEGIQNINNENNTAVELTSNELLFCVNSNNDFQAQLKITKDGITKTNGKATEVFAADGSIVDLSTKANKSDLDAKANKSDVLLKKSADGGYYIEANSNTLGQKAFAANSTCTASSYQSFAEGYGTEARERQCHAEGYNTIASGHVSHAEGESTVANGYCSHAQGSYNIDNIDAIHSIGIGNHKARKNAEYIYAKSEFGAGLEDDPKNGYKYLIGVGGYDGISTNNNTYKSVQEVIADLTARIEQLETKVKALEDANTPA